MTAGRGTGGGGADRERVRAELRQVRILWGAFMGGVALYTAVGWYVARSGVLASEGLDPGIVNAVATGVLVYMIAGVVFRRALVARLPRTDAAARSERYRVATMIGLALIESGGLVIITLGVLSHAPAWVLAGGSSALVMMLFARPYERDLLP